MQLLQITTTPIQYELQVERARLEVHSEFQPKFDMNQQDAQLKLQTTPTEIRLDSYEMRRTLGFSSVKDIVGDAASRGMENVTQKMGEYRDFGKQMAQSDQGTTIADILRQKMLEQPSSYTVFLPSEGVEVSWVPGNLDTQYQRGDLSFDWAPTPGSMDFIPGSVRMKILEYPRVNIEYLGRPMYIPPSADPEYVEPDA